MRLIWEVVEAIAITLGFIILGLAFARCIGINDAPTTVLIGQESESWSHRTKSSD